MLQVKIKFRVNFLNFGRFSISNQFPLSPSLPREQRLHFRSMSWRAKSTNFIHELGLGNK